MIQIYPIILLNPFQRSYVMGVPHNGWFMNVYDGILRGFHWDSWNVLFFFVDL